MKHFASDPTGLINPIFGNFFVGNIDFFSYYYLLLHIQDVYKCYVKLFLNKYCVWSYEKHFFKKLYFLLQKPKRTIENLKKLDLY